VLSLDWLPVAVTAGPFVPLLLDPDSAAGAAAPPAAVDPPRVRRRWRSVRAARSAGSSRRLAAGSSRRGPEAVVRLPRSPEPRLSRSRPDPDVL
jgi:hypothetical protein